MSGNQADTGQSAHSGAAIAVCLLATAIATAADLSLSAINGYSLRLDRVPLVLWDAAGLLAAAGLILIAIAIGRRIVKSVISIPVMRAAECLFAAWIPVALLTLRHHHEPNLLVAFGATGIVIVLIAIVEARGRLRVATRATAMCAAIVSVGTIAAVTTFTLPGRNLISPAEAKSGVTPGGPNLLLIVLDTLRADHVGTYGYSRPVTPWLDEFAKGATVYERAVAPSSYTLPTHATLFTGLYPESHGAMENDRHDGVSLEKLGLLADHANVSPLPDEAVTLAELMSEKGYETAAICANSAYLARAFNLDQGFKTYVDATGSREAWRPVGLLIAAKFPIPQKWRFYRMIGSNERYYLFANEINELTYRWMKGRTDRPYFLFLNYMEAHAPHFAMPGYRDLYPNSYALQTADWGAVNRGEQEFPEQQKSALVDAYDAQIKSLDDRLRELFERLESAGMLTNTVVVLCGDHGESFYEHKMLGHAVTLFEPEVWVPLIIKQPKQADGARVSKVVDMTDVAPTVLGAVGLPVPDAAEGSDLSAEQRKLPIVSHLGPYEREYSEYGVYSDPWKLLWRSDAEPRLFNIREDGAESIDRAADEPERVKELLTLLDTFRNRPGPRLQGGAMTMDDETRERLEAVGYGQAH